MAESDLSNLTVDEMIEADESYQEIVDRAVQAVRHLALNDYSVSTPDDDEAKLARFYISTDDEFVLVWAHYEPGCYDSPSEFHAIRQTVSLLLIQSDKDDFDAWAAEQVAAREAAEKARKAASLAADAERERRTYEALKAKFG